MLACPLCHTPLSRTRHSYVCQNQHGFDIAKEGYVNLHAVQHKNSHQAGDTLSSLQARTRFLGGGFYAPLRQNAVEILQTHRPIKPNTALDIGAGVGYYTEALADLFANVVGLDIAKPAIKLASRADQKRHTTTKSPIQWVVGTSAVLPILDNSVGVCTSFFSPLPVSEMHRVLADDGRLLVAVAGERHLLALRERLFDTVRPHNPAKVAKLLAPVFCQTDEWVINHEFTLQFNAISDLIAMTPYAYKATPTNRKRVLDLPKLTLTAQFYLAMFKKAG